MLGGIFGGRTRAAVIDKAASKAEQIIADIELASHAASREDVGPEDMFLDVDDFGMLFLNNSFPASGAPNLALLKAVSDTGAVQDHVRTLLPNATSVELSLTETNCSGQPGYAGCLYVAFTDQGARQIAERVSVETAVLPKRKLRPLSLRLAISG